SRGALGGAPANLRLAESPRPPFEPRRVAQGAGMRALGKPVCDHPGEGFRGRVDSLERGLVVEVPEVQLGEDGAQGLRGPADVDDNAVLIELFAPEGRVDDVGRAVEPL